MGWANAKRSAWSARDALRLMIGDTNAGNPLLSDQETDYYLGKTSSDPGCFCQAVYRPQRRLGAQVAVASAGQ